MSVPVFKVPLNLQNQYTYLKNKRKQKGDLLSDFSRQLSKNKDDRLPKIGDKYASKSVRKVEDQLNSLKLMLLAREKRQLQILSQQRFRQNYPNIIMQMPMGGYYIPQPLQKQVVKPQPQNVVVQKKNQQPKQQIVAPPQPEVQERGPKIINKFQKKSKLNRFRICAYAVYFSIYIKYFSKKFTQNRKNWFDQRYAINNGKVIFDGSANILRQLYEVDIYKMVLDGKRKAKQLDQDTMKISKDNVKNVFMGGTANFSLILLDFLRQLMTSQKFIQENHEVFTVGVLNQNFMISNLYLPQQADILYIHPSGYIQIDEETQILMLMIKIIVKITVFNFLISLRFSRQWNLKQEKSYNLDHTDIQELWQITRTAGIFFVIACEEIYDSTVRNFTHTCNFSQMAPKFGIVAAKNLEEMKDRKNNNTQQQSSKLQQTSTTLGKCLFIKDLQKYNQVSTMIAKTPYLQRFKQKLKMKIIDFLTQVYTCLKYEEYYVYDFIRNMTIQEKYLILQGKKREMQEKKKKNKKNKKRKGKDSDKNISFFNSQAKQSKGNSKWSQNYNGDSQSLMPNSSIGYLNPHNQSEDWQEGESEDEQEDKQNEKGKRMRYKHEQVFYDRKFRGHNKLQRLKHKMKLLKTNKVL